MADEDHITEITPELLMQRLGFTRNQAEDCTELTVREIMNVLNKAESWGRSWIKRAGIESHKRRQTTGEKLYQLEDVNSALARQRGQGWRRGQRNT